MSTTWDTAVAVGVKDGTIKKQAPLHEHDRKEGFTTELVVEKAYGVKRATGMGKTVDEAKTALITELNRAYPNGPVKSSRTTAKAGAGEAKSEE